jgi:hypothetical protein
MVIESKPQPVVKGIMNGSAAHEGPTYIFVAVAFKFGHIN